MNSACWKSSGPKVCIWDRTGRAAEGIRGTTGVAGLLVLVAGDDDFFPPGIGICKFKSPSKSASQSSSSEEALSFPSKASVLSLSSNASKAASWSKLFACWSWCFNSLKLTSSGRISSGPLIGFPLILFLRPAWDGDSKVLLPPPSEVQTSLLLDSKRRRTSPAVCTSPSKSFAQSSVANESLQSSICLIFGQDSCSQSSVVKESLQSSISFLSGRSAVGGGLGR
mmetsp:Transcript_15972/g.21116  ORF Transcript_15972/g.21116 Transcript_15972/m.21116 type:complete len:225 (-) Transcript_15972:1521-2195(-)